MSSSKHAYHFTYQTTCLVTGRYYLGMHSTNKLDDGYLGSGKVIISSIKEHGPQTHVRIILTMCNDRQQLSQHEISLITKDHLRNPLCMNLMPGGYGGCRSDEQREKIRRTLTGRKALPETIEAMRRANFGKVRTLETRQAISKANKGVPKSDEHKQALRIAKAIRHASVVPVHQRVILLRRDLMPFKEIARLFLEEGIVISVQKLKGISSTHNRGLCKVCRSVA